MTSTETAGTEQATGTTQVHRVYIKATPGADLAGDHRPGVERPLRLLGPGRVRPAAGRHATGRSPRRR